MIDAILVYWPQITGAIFLVFYIARVNASVDARLKSLEDEMRRQMAALWERHNRLIDYLLEKKEK